MTIVIPLRVLTATTGLLIGYYAGLIMENEWKPRSTIGQLVNILSKIYNNGQKVIDYYSSDDEYDVILTWSTPDPVLPSDDDTSYSE